MSAASPWFVYMIETQCGLLYTGISTDVVRRFDEHANDKQKGAKFFRGRQPRAVVYRQAWSNRSEASKREAAIKKLTRAQKLQMVAAYQG